MLIPMIQEMVSKLSSTVKISVIIVSILILSSYIIYLNWSLMNCCK